MVIGGLDSPPDVIVAANMGRKSVYDVLRACKVKLLAKT